MEKYSMNITDIKYLNSLTGNFSVKINQKISAAEPILRVGNTGSLKAAEPNLNKGQLFY